jgi:hypothetical protein
MSLYFSKLNSQIVILSSSDFTSTQSFSNSFFIASILFDSFKFKVFNQVIFVFQAKNIAKLIKLIETSGIFSKFTSRFSNQFIISFIQFDLKIVVSQSLSKSNQKIFCKISKYL